MAANRKSKPRAFEKMNKDATCFIPINLMQNCDLPPPVKLFSISSPGEAFHSSISETGGHETKKDQKLIHKDFSGYNDELGILKALRLSQTRAREAERKLKILSNEKEMLSKVLMDESLKLSACRQWVSLLELQVLELQRQQQQEENTTNMWSRIVPKKIAFCLAIAGTGFAIGCKYLF